KAAAGATTTSRNVPTWSCARLALGSENPFEDGGASRLITATRRVSPANTTAASAAGSRSFFNVSGMAVQRSRVGPLVSGHSVFSDRLSFRAQDFHITERD